MAGSNHPTIIRGAKAGTLFVAAAGNSTIDTDVTANDPSNYSTLQATSTTLAATYEAVISVAGLTSSGGLASFSNDGATTVDIAPRGLAVAGRPAYTVAASWAGWPGSAT